MTESSGGERRNAVQGFPPGPTAPAAYQSWRMHFRTLETLRDCARQYGKRFTWRVLGGDRYVFLSDPADIKMVFEAPGENFANTNGFWQYVFGEQSLFVLEGAQHRRHQKWLVPIMRRERVLNFTLPLQDVLLEDMRTWPVGAPIPIMARMQEIVQRAIYRVLLGISDPALAEKIRKLRNDLTVMMIGWNNWMLGLAVNKPALQKDLGPLTPWPRFHRLRTELFALLRAEVQAARNDPGDRDDLVVRMIRQAEADGTPATDEEIMHEMSTLTAAADDPTVAALGWAFHWILKDPEANRKVHAELKEVVGDGPVQPEHIAKLRYLTAAVNEAMRISALFPFIPRKLAKETRVGDYLLPAGTHVLPCAYLTHHDPELFPEPEKFLPERFLDKRRGPYEFFPFGGGFRHCVGNALAVYESTLLIAATLSRADLRLVNPEEKGKLFGFGSGLVPAEGTPVLMDRFRG